MADAVMSLDNVIALVQAARIGGEVDISLLVIGLATTIPLVIFGAALLTSLLTRFPFLVYRAPVCSSTWPSRCSSPTK